MVRAILVEDNREFRRCLKKILGTHYPLIQVTEAENEEEVLKEIDRLPPDLIFMDIHLPGKNGLQLTQEIKSRYPNIVVIVLTGYDLPEYQETAYRSGANYFLSKDSSMGDFFALVESVTQRCSSGLN